MSCTSHNEIVSSDMRPQGDHEAIHVRWHHTPSLAFLPPPEAFHRPIRPTAPTLTPTRRPHEAPCECDALCVRAIACGAVGGERPSRSRTRGWDRALEAGVQYARAAGRRKDVGEGEEEKSARGERGRRMGGGMLGGERCVCVAGGREDGEGGLGPPTE